MIPKRDGKLWILGWTDAYPRNHYVFYCPNSHCSLKGTFLYFYTLSLWMGKPVCPTANLNALQYGQRFISLKSSLVLILENIDEMKDAFVSWRSKKLLPEKRRFDPGMQGGCRWGWMPTWKQCSPLERAQPEHRGAVLSLKWLLHNKTFPQKNNFLETDRKTRKNLHGMRGPRSLPFDFSGMSHQRKSTFGLTLGFQYPLLTREELKYVQKTLSVWP